MGVNLRDLFPQHSVPDGWYQGKRIAIDGHNTAFRYLTSIRDRDGDLLRSKDTDRPIGHILGFTGLVRQLRLAGAEPIVIWDGDIHPRKQATVDGRIAKRKAALEQAEAARAAGDHALYRRLAPQTTYLDGTMIEDCSRVLETAGVAVIRAPHDGERYAAALCHANMADAVATEDFDALVAGAPTVLRKAGSAQPWLLRLSDLDRHGISVDQLRQLAIVCGTDWHPGVRGMGPKTTLKAFQHHPDLTEAFKEAAAGVVETRLHKAIVKSDLDAEEFAALDNYVATLPAPDPIRTAKPCPEMASAVAEEVGVDATRVLGCLC